jgi:hypothetical protein
MRVGEHREFICKTCGIASISRFVITPKLVLPASEDASEPPSRLTAPLATLAKHKQAPPLSVDRHIAMPSSEGDEHARDKQAPPPLVDRHLAVSCAPEGDEHAMASRHGKSLA